MRGEERERKLDHESFGSSAHASYREGVVRLFIILCEEAQRLYGDDLGRLTPRELQEELVERIPEGDFAVEDLVTTFEAVTYGGGKLSEEEFEGYEASVELLLGLMGGSSLGEIGGGKPLVEKPSGGPMSLFLFLLLGGVVVIVLFVFQRRIESMIGELVSVFRSIWVKSPVRSQLKEVTQATFSPTGLIASTFSSSSLARSSSSVNAPRSTLMVSITALV